MNQPFLLWAGYHLYETRRLYMEQNDCGEALRNLSTELKHYKMMTHLEYGTCELSYNGDKIW